VTTSLTMDAGPTVREVFGPEQTGTGELGGLVDLSVSTFVA